MGSGRNIKSPGCHSHDFIALVHTPVKPSDFRKIGGALKAVDDEFHYLSNQGTWPLHTVREKRVVTKEAQAKQKKCNFSNVMELCRVKHFQLELQFHT